MATAQRIKGITVEINGDTRKLQDALKNVNKSINETSTALKDVNKLLKMDPGNATLLKQKQELLAKAITDTKAKLEQEKEALKQMNEAGDSSKTIQQQQALQREIADTTLQLKKFQEEAMKSGSVLGSQMQVAGDKIKQVGDNVTAIGGNMTRYVTTPILGAGAAIIKVGMDFDTAMSSVRAKTRASDEEFQLLRDTAREWGANTRYSATEVAEAMDYMAMAGWKTQQIVAGVGDVLNLAIVGQSDLATTSDIVTDALSAFNLQASDAARFANVMAATIVNANTDVEMLGESYKYAGSVAGSFGYNIEDVNIALGLMANRGIKASQAGTALRSLFQRMASQPKQAAAAMQALNLSLTDLDTGNAKSMMEVMTDLRSAFKGVKLDSEGLTEGIADVNAQLEAGELSNDQADKAMEKLIKRYVEAESVTKAMYAAQIAGTAGMTGLLGILNATDEEFQSLTNSIYNSDGAASEMAGVMGDNLEGDMAELNSAIQEIAISLSDVIAPTLRELADILTAAAQQFGTLTDEQKEAVVQAGAILAAFGPVVMVFGTLISAIGTICTAIGSAISFIGGLTTAAGGSSVALGEVAAAIPGIGTAIAFVIAAITVWIKNWEDIKAMFTDGIPYALGVLVNKFASTWNTVGNGIKNFVNNVKGDFNRMKHEIETQMNVIRRSIETKFKEIVDKAKTWGTDMIQGLIDGITEKVKDVEKTAESIANAISEYIHFSEPDKGPLSNFHTFMPDMIRELARGINGSINLLNNPMTNLANAINPTQSIELSYSKQMSGQMSDLTNAIGGMGAQNVNVILEGDAAGIFRAVKRENGIYRKRTGSSAFA